MGENKYDDPVFFDKYSRMARSRQGLSGAGEWKTLEKLLPGFAGKRVLDLGCGYGWHCRYAAEHGAASVVGVDCSERMLAVAREKTADLPQVTYAKEAMEDVDFSPESFDVVLSSLAFHYVEDFPALREKIRRWLVPGGDFVFSVEHPIFTARGDQDWLYGPGGPSFVHTMRRLAAEDPGRTLKVVDDQFGNPTSTDAVADALTAFLARPELRGTFHLTCEGVVTWCGFTREILRLAGFDGVTVSPCTTEEYPRPAPRPHYSALSKAKLAACGLPPMPPWQEALARFVAAEWPRQEA